MASESHHLASTMARNLPSDSTGLSSAFLQQPTPDEEALAPEYDHDHDHDTLFRLDHDHNPSLRNRYRRDYDESEQNISIPASSKQAEQTVAPFLAKHIPVLHHPVGGATRAPQSQPHKLDLETPRAQPPNNTKFCYRHHPDLKCRRQANEPSMEQLQNELASLSQSDQQAISHVWSLFSAAPAKHRNLMLQGILTQCCFPQLSYISASVRDLIKIDFLSALPAELGFKILCSLDTASLCRAAQVSRRWRELADDDVVWHKMCEQHIDRKCTKCGWGLPLLERKRLRIEKRQIQLRATGRGLNQWSPNITPIPEEIGDETTTTAQQAGPSSETATKRRAEAESSLPRLAKKQCTRSLSEGSRPQENGDSYFESRKRPWKDIYKDRFKVGTAWKYGRCNTKVFRGHTNGVTCLQFDDNVLITGSYDTTIKVWDIESGQEIRTLKGHTSGIRCLQFDDKDKLMTGSLDSTLRLWNWKTGQCLRTFQAHTDGIISLHFAGGFVATGSMDKTVRVWNSKTNSTFLLRGHTDWVNCVKIDLASRTLFSASDDLTVRLWDLDTHQPIRTFDGHVGQVQQVVPLPPEFELEPQTHGASEKDDDASSVSSFGPHGSQARNGSVSEQPAPFWPNDPERPAPPRYILTASLDGVIRLWDVHDVDASGHKAESNEPPTPSTDTQIIPTDPLSNSHVPRAKSCIRTFFGHVEGVWALAADHLRLVSGSEDKMVKVWDPRTSKCERTFVGHQGPVTCAWLSDSRLASGSEDCEVRMLNFGDIPDS